MPTASDLQKIASLLYDKPVGTVYTSDLTYNGKASELGLPEPWFYIWSGLVSDTNNNMVYDRGFGPTSTEWSKHTHSRGSSSPLGLCLVE